MIHQAHDSRSSYRPDIDGLRAIAVLAVVLFHINPALLPGGFAGVDIFFVISGFLITGNILKDASSPQGFSWREFYRRRILRILPVLFVVLLATLLVGQFVLIPADLSTLSYSAIASLLSAANIYFTYFLDTSYFAEDSSLQPLLHLWSLGVEEQFYLLWPLALIALHRRVSLTALLGVTLAIAVASFVLAQTLLNSAPMFAYYMLPARAGELLVGALLAIWLSRRSPTLPDWLKQVLGVTGLLLIVASIGWITEDMSFPGFTALPSTLGAGLLIWAGAGKARGVSRVLALKPMVLIGLISYSLYLWHWPVLAFYRYAYGSVEALPGILLFVLMLILSVLSYRFVEKPFRQLRWQFSWTLTRVFGTGTFAITVICISLLASRGYGVYAFDKEYRAALGALEPSPAAFNYPYVCQRPLLRERELNNPACIINSETEPGVLLWGDSNAGHYVGVLGAIAEKANFAFRNAAHSSCPPFLRGAEITQQPDRVEHCLASINTVKNHLNRYHTIILAAAWEANFAKGESPRKLFEQTVDTLTAQGKHVIILGQVPGFRDVNRKCHEKSLKLPMLQCERFGLEADHGDFESNQYLAAFAAARPNVEYFNVRDQICRNGSCSAYLQGQLLYFDRSHLSLKGSWTLGRAILQSEGLPAAFIKLKNTQHSTVTTSSISLEQSLLNRGQARFEKPVSGWRTILPSENKNNWPGTAHQQHKATSALLSDHQADTFNFISYSADQQEINTLAQSGEALRVRLHITSCTNGIPMVRIITHQGAEVIKHDLVLDCHSGKIKAKGGLDILNANVIRKGDVFTVQIIQPLSSKLEKLTLSIYPASGTKFGRYDVKATGDIEARVDITTIRGL